MKTIAFSALAVALLTVSFQPASATTGPSGISLPKCPDSVVGVSSKYRVYVTAAQLKAQEPNMTADQFKAWMDKNSIKLMCKGQAVAFGAQPITSKNPKIPTAGGVGNANDLGGVR